MGKLAVVDLLLLVATIAIAAGAGLWLGRRATSARGFLVGERDVPWPAVLLSIVATETSSVTFLSVPGVAFTRDLRFLQLPLGYLLGRIVVARWLLPAYFESDALTSYEVLGRRFGSGVKHASSLLFLVTRTLADGMRLYLTAVPLQMLTGWSLGASIAVMASVTVLYSWWGGVRAVVWTDVVQFFIYVAGGVLALCVALHDVPGGASGAWELARSAGKLRVFDFTLFEADGSLAIGRTDLFWAGLLGGGFLTVATHGTDQLMVQRYLCARGPREAGKALIASGVVVLLQFALFLAVGLALFAWFHARPAGDPAADSPMRGDDVFRTFIVQRLTQIPGAVGLVLGAVFAVSMSTLSSSLNASAGAVVNDWLKPLLRRPLADGGELAGSSALRASRLATVAFAVIQATVALAGSRERSVVDVVLSIASFTTGLTLGLFLLARVLPRAGGDSTNQPSQANDAATRMARMQGRAALAAFLVMLAVMTWVWRGTRVAWPWYSLIGSLGTLGVGLALVWWMRVMKRGDAR